ncbi:MAG: hypothetical protein ABIT08_12245 [Bacteroidia bacterium]
MEQFHPIENRDYQELLWTLNNITFHIGSKLDRNPSFDERGLTDELLDSLQERIKQIKFSNCFINLKIEKPSEKKTGADIIFRILFNQSEISFDRYVLMQAKKFSIKNKKFSETNIGNSHLNGQVKRMHSYNPEFSYLLLYSTTEEPIGNIVIEHYYSHCRYHPKFEDLFIVMQLQGIKKVEGNYPVAILRAKSWEKMKNNKPRTLLSHSENFPSFILDDLITGKIGKDWDTKIEKGKGDFSFIVTLTIGQR